MTENNEYAIGEEWFRKREEMTKQNLRCNDLAQDFRAGQLDQLVPLWHTEKDQIDFNKQPHPIDENLLSDGYNILSDINFEKLLSSFYGGLDSFIKDRAIVNRSGFIDNQLCRIFEHWRNDEPLIPAFIFFNDAMGQNFPADGKHRLKVAYYLGATKVPIIVSNKHLQGVSALVL